MMNNTKKWQLNYIPKNYIFNCPAHEILALLPKEPTLAPYRIRMEFMASRACNYELGSGMHAYRKTMPRATTASLSPP